MAKKLFGSMAMALLVLALVFPALAAERTVVITLGDLRPEKLEIARGDEVTWINASGGLAHVQFAAEPAGHELIQKGGTIRMKCDHLPMTHRYVVHISGTKGRMLTGSILVSEGQPAPQSQGERLRRLFPKFNITDEGVIDTGGG